jgi:hypothetical protein
MAGLPNNAPWKGAYGGEFLTIHVIVWGILQFLRMLSPIRLLSLYTLETAGTFSAMRN